MAILAVTSSVFVSVGYLPQPALGMIAESLNAGSDAVGWAATSAQLGTAFGILLLVPMSDIVRPRVQIEIQTAVACLALLGAALAPNLLTLCIAIFVAGFMANLAQVITPLAVRTAPQGLTAKTTGTLAGSLLFGIFGGRIFAGLIAEYFGWRAIFLGAAVLVALMAPLIRIVLHSSVDAPTKASYPSLLKSLPTIARDNPGVSRSAAIQFLVFAAFNSLWTVIALHLTADGIGWTAAQAGFIGIVGLAAGILTSFTGWVIARVGPVNVLGAALALVLVGCAAIIVPAAPLGLVISALFVLTVGNQAAMVSNQTRALSGMSHAAGRANTVYMFGAFLGGSVGAAVGSFAFSHGGISVTAQCATIAALMASAVAARSAWRRR